jgi:SnoaL-like domain
MPALDRANPTAWADAFIASIIEERVPDVIAGYDPSERTYVFLEGPRWSTVTGAAVATGWTAYLNSPIRMRGYDWVEGPFAQIAETMGWIAGILDLHVNVGGIDRTLRLRGTYVLTEHSPGDWGIVHEHFSAPDPDPYGMGDWLPSTPGSASEPPEPSAGNV